MPGFCECPWEEGRGKVFFHFLSPAPPPCPYPYCFSPSFPARLAAGLLSFPLFPPLCPPCSSRPPLLPLHKQLEQTTLLVHAAGWEVFRSASVKKLKDGAGVGLVFSIRTPLALAMGNTVAPTHGLLFPGKALINRDDRQPGTSAVLVGGKHPFNGFEPSF